MSIKRWNLINKNLFDNSYKVLKQINLDRKIVENLDDLLLEKKENIIFHNPSYLPDVNIGYERIKNAIDNNEKICIYGDYDVDGITSTAILLKTFNKLNADVTYYIPNRFEEGYGMNIHAIDKIKDMGVSLIITVDCGITSIEEVEYAQKKGIDVIITDHHNPQEILPNAIAVINPKVNNNYPYDMLAGAGVAFKFSEYILSEKICDIYDELIFLSMLGTISDLVPILDENRSIVKKGIDLYKKGMNIGFDALAEVVGINLNIAINENDISFKIAPCLNASGRLSNAMLAVELLMSNDIIRVKELAAELNKLNNLRKNKTNSIYKDSMKLIERDSIYQFSNITVVYNDSWHEGVLGIVASKLVEKYYLPAIVLTENNGIYKGSARSIDDFSIFDAINENKEHLEKFGGHNQAAGLSIRKENIIKFIHSLKEYTDKHLLKSMLIQKINIDYKIDISVLNLDFYDKILLFSPFGVDNKMPTFVSYNVDIFSARLIGKTSEHLKLTISKDGKIFDGIMFFYDKNYLPITNVRADIIYEIDKNVYNNQTNLQLMIKDIRFYSPNANIFSKKVFEYYCIKLFEWLCKSNISDNYELLNNDWDYNYKERNLEYLINLIKNNENIVITSYEALLEVTYLLYDLGFISEDISIDYLDKFKNIKVLPLKPERAFYIDIPLLYNNDKNFMQSLQFNDISIKNNDNSYIFGNINNWSYNRKHFINLYKEIVDKKIINLSDKISSSNDILSDIIAYSFFDESNFINYKNGKISHNTKLHKKTDFYKCNINNKLEYIKKLVRINRWI